jgi:hypothetical protein
MARANALAQPPTAEGLRRVWGSNPPPQLDHEAVDDRPATAHLNSDLA